VELAWIGKNVERHAIEIRGLVGKPRRCSGSLSFCI